MTEPTIISGHNEAEIKQQLQAYFNNEESLFQHFLSLQQNGQVVLIEIDIDPGGGFESGYATTRFSAQVAAQNSFAFTIHPEGFLADLGKLFGLQDEVIGYPEFDEKMIIKTNNKERVHRVFSNKEVRQTLSALTTFNLQLKNVDAEKAQQVLLLEIEEGITEGDKLMQLYLAFYALLNALHANT